MLNGIDTKAGKTELLLLIQLILLKRKTILTEKLKEKYYFACEIHTILQFFIQFFYSRTLELFYGDVI